MSFFLNSYFITSVIPCDPLILVSEYLFQGSLQSTYNLSPDLVNVNPLGTNVFKNETPFGISRQVFQFNGNTSFAQNAGLTLNTTGTILEPDNYTIELIFRFFGTSSWAKITDHRNRSSDAGFYVSPDNKFQIFPVVSGPSSFVDNQWYRVFLCCYTKNGVNLVKLYNNTTLEFDVPTDQLKLNNSNNPSRLLHFFLDDSVQGTEYSSGQVALIRLYNNVACNETKLPPLQLGPLL